MRGILLLSLAVSQTAASLSLHKRSEPNTLSFGIERRSNNVHSKRKRDTSSATITSTDDFNLYSFNFTLGTPGQQISVGLDTGSSDLWVNAKNSTYCTENSDECASTDKFDPKKSSTYAVVNDEFEISYGDGTGADGDYATDTLKFGDATLEKFQFGVGYDTSTELGIMGIGYASLEAVNDIGYFDFDDLDDDDEDDEDDDEDENISQYKNLPQALVKGGYINSPAYSLWLDDLEARKGTILFGGVNTAKYAGELHTLPIIPEDGEYLEFLVNMTGLRFNNGSGEASYTGKEWGFPSPVLLDSGTTLTYLPDDTVDDIINTVAVYDWETQEYTIDCDLKNSGYNLTFEFSGFSLTVDIAEMVLTDTDSDTCIFGIDYQGDDLAILGDTFLRSAYVVYDLGNNEISMAPANFNPGEDNVLEIGTGSTALPTATGAPTTTAIATTATATGTAAGATGTSGSSSSTSKGAAPMITSSPKLIAGLAGAGLLLAL